MSNNDKLQPLTRHIEQNKQFSELLNRAHRLRELDQQLQKKIPEQVRGICRLANIRGNIAVFTCYSQLEASKVRMYSRAILQVIQQDFKKTVNKIRIKIVLDM